MVQSLAVEPASVETRTWRSTRYKHWVDGFIVDGDYLLIKVNKRTWMRTEERLWNEVVPPFAVPEGEGTAVLINPENPFYIWDKKPDMWHPCWLRWEDLNLFITDMVTGEVIGRGMGCLADAFIFTGRQDLEQVDVWWLGMQVPRIYYEATGLEVAWVSRATKERILTEAKTCKYWHAIAHGDATHFLVDPSAKIAVFATEIGRILVGREPYVLSVCMHCGALEDIGPGTWSHVLTKNMRGHIVVGFKHTMDHPWLVVDQVDWMARFYGYLMIGNFIQDAFENALADAPGAAPVVDIYEGKSAIPEDFQNITVRVTPPQGGYVVPGSGLYDLGLLKLTAYPYPGYVFKEWYWSSPYGTGFLGGNPWHLELAASSVYTILAIFDQEELPLVRTRTLAMCVSPAGSGTTSPPVGLHTYSEGDSAPIAAYPNPGYAFHHWGVMA